MINFFAAKINKRIGTLPNMPNIIIKVDDLYGYTRPMKHFVDFAFKQNIKVCLGIIGKSLENPDKVYVEWLYKILKTGKVELFNHGYLHERPLELCGPSLEEQKTTILKTQDIVKEKLGVTIHTIGTPENAKDDKTLVAVESIPEINTWFFGHDDYSKNLYKREIYLEKPFPMPSLNHILDGFKTKADSLKVVVLECHPQLWDAEDWKIFYKIIKFLKINNAKFVLSQELIR